MKKELNLRIPEPCHENWNDMTPNARGRHCDSCAKTVVDFTNKTDEAIIKIYESEQHLCGRFKTDQLNRPLIMERREPSVWTSVAAVAAFTLMTLQSVDANAQGAPKIVQTDTFHNGYLKGKIATSILNDRVIKGVVLDADSIPLAGANILIKGTTVGTITDFNGNYSLRVKNGDTLVCSYVGYETLEIAITPDTNFNVTMQMSDLELMGEIVVVGGLVSGDYEHIPSPEELEEQRRLRELRNENNRKFYKRKRLEEQEQKRARRQKRRTHE